MKNIVGIFLMATVCFCTQHSWGSEKELSNKVLSLTLAYFLSTKGIAMKAFVLAHPVGVGVAVVVAVPVTYYGCKYLYYRFNDWQAKRQRAQAIQNFNAISKTIDKNVQKSTEESNNRNTISESTTQVHVELDELKEDLKTRQEDFESTKKVVDEVVKQPEKSDNREQPKNGSGWRVTGEFLFGLGNPYDHENNPYKNSLKEKSKIKDT